MDSRSPSMLKATLIGGVAAAVVGSLPIVGMLNACCCALIIAGGFLAAFLYRRDCVAMSSRFGPGQGAVVGLVAGAMYAITATLIAVVMITLSGGKEWLYEQIDAAAAMNPQSAEGLEPLLTFVDNTSGFMLGFILSCVQVILGAVFSTVGGLIGGSVFKFEPPPPPAPTAGGTTPPPPPVAGP